MEQEITEAHLRYLTVIYDISLKNSDVSSSDIARELGVKRPSVTSMLACLTEKKLIVKKKYGKVYLTGNGFIIAKRCRVMAEILYGRLAGVCPELTESECRTLANVIAMTLSKAKFKKRT